MKRFIKVSFPDSQKLNDSNRFNECYKLNLEEDDTYKFEFTKKKKKLRNVRFSV